MCEKNRSDLSFTSSPSSLIVITAVLVILGWFLNSMMFKNQEKEIKNLSAKVSALSDPKRTDVSGISEDEVRILGGKLEATQVGNVLYFRAFTIAKPPSGEKFRVPITSISEVMTAIQSTTQALGPSYIAMSVAPEIGVYEGKVALMGVVVTLPPARMFK